MSQFFFKTRFAANLLIVTPLQNNTMVSSWRESLLTLSISNNRLVFLHLQLWMPISLILRDQQLADFFTWDLFYLPISPTFAKVWNCNWCTSTHNTSRFGCLLFFYNCSQKNNSFRSLSKFYLIICRWHSGDEHHWH